MIFRHRRIVYLRIFCALVLLVIANYLHAQEKIPFIKYGVEEGLPEEYVTSTLQDDQGFIWLATQNGLVKYDGYEFEVMRQPLENNKDFLRNILGGIRNGKDGKIWVAGFWSKGLASYDPITEKFTNQPEDSAELSKLPFDYSSLLFEDLYHNIWFSNGGGAADSTLLCRLDQNTNKVYTYPLSVLQWYNNIVNNWQMVEVSEDSSIWFLDQARYLKRYNRTTDAFELMVDVKKEWYLDSSANIRVQDLTYTGKKSFLNITNKKDLYLYDPIKRKLVNQYVHGQKSGPRWGGGSSCEDFQGIYWISKRNVLTKINPVKDEITHYRIGEDLFKNKYPFIPASLFIMFMDEEYVWFENSYRYEGSRKTFFKYDVQADQFIWLGPKMNDEENDFPTRWTGFFTTQVIKDRTGILWLNNRPNVYKSDPKRGTIDHFLPGPNSSQLSSVEVNDLLEDSNKRLWIGTNNGLALYRDETEDFKTFKKDQTDNKSLSSNEILKLFETKEGELWIGTNSGLNRLNTRTNKVRRYFADEENNRVLAIERYGKDGLIVSLRGNGVYYFNRETDTFTKIDDFQISIRAEGFNRIFHDSNGRTWVASNQHLANGVFMQNANEQEWTYFQHDSKDTATLYGNPINFIYEDELNQIWVATSFGLNKFDEQKQKFTRLTDSYNISFTSIAEKNSSLWLGSYTNDGLYKYDQRDNTFKLIGIEDGLLHTDIICSPKLPIDQGNQIYIPTQLGLSVYNPGNKSFANFKEKDGFKPGRNYEALIRENGEIWMGSSGGLNLIKREKLFKRDSTPPQVVIKSIQVLDREYASPDGELFHKAVSHTGKLNLDYSQKDISFEFVALHFLRPDDNQYSWKLEKYDQDWTDPSFERKAKYTNLSPGTYTFRVKASNADGIWNEEGASILIVIAPPFWKTYWAYGFYFVLLCFGVLAVHKIQKTRVIRKERERAKDRDLAQAKEIEKAYAELKATQSQLIQAEKMASLGELTAGIAHEIQNPLNFVNNFSDVNKELIEELIEEMNNGNIDEANAIAKDIFGNEEKVIHHGKRADDIVKSMLQHSRGSEGKKEPTDINALCDEYLRLAYHGLRAKDKSFNANFDTDLDPNLPKIDVVPQDIGRVLLNLINNAFQASSTDRQAGEADGDDKPRVVVSTKLTGDQVQIFVSDNGPGIPDNIKDKIFQPFFTTKPAGKGTGLGLSMSYEIVTKGHGGKLELKPGNEGTTFIVKLPV